MARTWPGFIGHAKETGLYKAVRGPVKGFHQGMALSYLCCRQVTAVWKTVSREIILEAENNLGIYLVVQMGVDGSLN